MNPQSQFCPNSACPARGQVGQDNIVVHSRKGQRYTCKQCGKTFSARTGTAVYRVHKPLAMVVQVLTLLAYGCPVQAIVMAFGLDERTVSSWHQRAGQHGERMHEYLVQVPRDLGQVQADELRVKTQRGIVWVAMALQVSTRLWLGGVLSARRDYTLVKTLMQKVRACALRAPLLVCTDGFSAYARAIRAAFRDPLRRGHIGRPRLRVWEQLFIAQVVKQYAQRHVVGILRRIVQGSAAQIDALVQHSQGGGSINTAYIERLNATFRARLTTLVRRTRALARHTATLVHALYWMGTVYNFCTDHPSLRVRHTGRGLKWLSRTPAMAAGLTDHRWTITELLLFRVPLPRWSPPKRRGRPSARTKQLIAQWCT